MLFPNPAIDKISIKDTVGEIEITNLLGTTVKTIKNYNGESINLNRLNSGIYIAKTKNGAFQFIKL
ncbi:MAG: T9SS type A sorting domain-containing protein [Paludibacter sp.]